MNDGEQRTDLTEEEITAMYNSMKNAASSDVPRITNAQTAVSESSNEILVDNYNFPFEPEGIYNSAMLDFEEIAGALWTLIAQTHYCATRYNRLSPNYTMLMQHLEKDMKQMGSYCITKVVLEQSGKELPGLKKVDLKELCCMVSLHFRKCCLAYNQIKKETGCQDMNLMNWIFRWANLFERLKATQDKIDKIKNGKVKIESLLETQNVYKDEPSVRRDTSDRIVDPQLKASAMPIIKSFAKEVKQQQKADEKKERAMQREAERSKRRLQKETNRLMSDVGVKIIPPMPLPKIPGLGLNEKELRQLLMDEAKSRMDMTEAGIIAREPVSKLVERFEKLSGLFPASGGQKSDAMVPLRDSGRRDSDVHSRSGPSDETRKKLREKRKKNRQ